MAAGSPPGIELHALAEGTTSLRPYSSLDLHSITTNPPIRLRARFRSFTESMSARADARDHCSCAKCTVATTPRTDSLRFDATVSIRTGGKIDHPGAVGKTLQWQRANFADLISPFGRHRRARYIASQLPVPQTRSLQGSDPRGHAAGQNHHPFAFLPQYRGFILYTVSIPSCPTAGALALEREKTRESRPPRRIAARYPHFPAPRRSTARSLILRRAARITVCGAATVCAGTWNGFVIARAERRGYLAQLPLIAGAVHGVGGTSSRFQTTRPPSPAGLPKPCAGIVLVDAA